VEGASTAPATLAAAMKVGRAIGKFSGHAGNCDCFSPTAAACPSTSSKA
jgi:hypothetical protein